MAGDEAALASIIPDSFLWTPNGDPDSAKHVGEGHSNVVESRAQKSSARVMGTREIVAARYLEGYPPFILTAGLRGPFDNGWVNPWLKETAPTSAAPRRRHHRPKVIPETQLGDEAPMDLNTTGKIALRGDPVCHLPSPESLQQLSVHKYLDKEDLGRVQGWREDVVTNSLKRDEFWVSGADEERTTKSARKRRADGAQWLKTRQKKRTRVENSTDTGDKSDEIEMDVDSPVTGLQRLTRSSQRVHLFGQTVSTTPTSRPSIVATTAQPSPKEKSTRFVEDSVSPYGKEQRKESTASQLHNKEAGPNFTFAPTQQGGAKASSSISPQEGTTTSSRHGPKGPTYQHSDAKRNARIVARVVKRTEATMHAKAKSVSEDELSREFGKVMVSRLSASFPAPSKIRHEPRRSSPGLRKRNSRPPSSASDLPKSDDGASDKVHHRLVQDLAGETPEATDSMASVPQQPRADTVQGRRMPGKLQQSMTGEASQRSEALAGGATDAGSSSEDIFGLDDGISVDSTLPDEVDSVIRMNAEAEAIQTNNDEEDMQRDELQGSTDASSSSREDAASPVTPTTLASKSSPICAPHSASASASRSKLKTNATGTPSQQGDETLQGTTETGSDLVACLSPKKAMAGAHEPHEPDDNLTSGKIDRPANTCTQRSSVVPVEDQSPWAKEISTADITGPAEEPSEPVAPETQVTSIVPPEAQTPWAKMTQDELVGSPLSSAVLDMIPLGDTSLADQTRSPIMNGAVENESNGRRTPRERTPERSSARDFSLKSFSAFLSPPKKRRRLRGATNGPTTPSILSSPVNGSPRKPRSGATTQKRVSWAPMPGEEHNDNSHWSGRSSPPPSMPIPDHPTEDELDVVDEGRFEKHFDLVRKRAARCLGASVAGRVAPARTGRILPTPSQQTQRSPQVDAMARAFVAADQRASSSGSPSFPASDGSGQARESISEGEADDDNEGQSEEQQQQEEEEEEGREEQTAEQGHGEPAGEEAAAETLEDGPVDEVEDIMANLDQFLNPWDVSTEGAHASGLAGAGAAGTPTSSVRVVGMEMGGW